MRYVSITRAKKDFYRLVELIKKGEEITITKWGKPAGVLRQTISG